MRLGTGYVTILDMSDVAIVSAVAPSNPKVDLIWLDTSLTPNLYKRWTGSSWVSTGVTLGDISEQISKTIPFIASTHATSTASWTGVAPFTTLTHGQQITYLLKQVPTGNATLNLTLEGGGTTGAINCYYLGSSRLTTQYGQGNIIRFTYLVNNRVGSTDYTGWWADANYSTDTYDRVLYNRAIPAKSAITASYLVVSDETGYFHLAAGSVFDYSKPILWAGSAISAGATGTNNFIAFSACSLSNNSPGISLTAQKSVYLKGVLNGTTFTVASAPFITDTPVDDGNIYMLLGQLYSTYQMTLCSQHDLYRFENGAFKSFQQIAYEALSKAKEKVDIYFNSPENIELPVTVGSLAYDLSTRTVWRYEGEDVTPNWSDQTYTLQGQAIEIALQAKSIAEGKVSSYTGATQPTDIKEGNLWYKTTENGRPYVCSGGQYIKLLGDDFTTLENSLSSVVQTLIGGMKIFRQAVAPAANVSSVGDLWYNTISGNACSKYNGTTWIPFSFTNLLAYIDSGSDLSTTTKKDQIVSIVRGSTLYQSDLNGKVSTEAFNSGLNAAIAGANLSTLTQVNSIVDTAVASEAARAQQIEALIQNTLTKYADYFTFLTNGLAIGKQGSEYSIMVTDGQISLRQGESEVLRIVNGQLVITKMKVADKIAIGNDEDGYSILDTMNGGLSFVWQATDPFA